MNQRLSYEFDDFRVETVSRLLMRAVDAVHADGFALQDSVAAEVVNGLKEYYGRD